MSPSDVNIIIGGIVTLTTIDYPGRLSAVLFCQGCPWRCKYCHNKHLQNISDSDGLPFEDIMLLINERKHFIDAVVFSGGEPLVQEGLIDAIKFVKKCNLLIGLHTTGVMPDRFAKTIGYVDWVGFDVKAPFDNYQKVIQIDSPAGLKAKESLEILLHSEKDYEVRITLDLCLESDELKDLFSELQEMGVQNLALQAVRDSDNQFIQHPILSDAGVISDLEKMFKNLIIRN